MMLGVLLTVLFIGQSVALAQDGSGTTPPSAYKLNLEQFTFEYQGWNNCGPTTMTMGLTYFGYAHDQNPAARWMKPHYEDKNVNPTEMVAFVNEEASLEVPVQAIYRPGGDLELLKTLLSNNFPVVIEKGYEPEGYDWMGHYLLLVGYDDTLQVFYNYDSFLGHGNFQGLTETYADVEKYWWHFNNLFMVIYPPNRSEELMTLLGDRADMVKAYQMAFNDAQAQATIDPENGWNWFNAGDALSELGYYEQATDYFRVAIDKGLPWRTLWYRHTPFEAFYQMGDYDTVTQLVNQSKQTTPYVEEFHYYQGLVFAAQGRDADARAQLNQALFYNKNYQAAKDIIAQLDNGTFRAPVAALQP